MPAKTPQAALSQLFTAPQIQTEWFAPSFLNAVPEAQLIAILQQIKASLGEYREIRSEGDRYLVVFDRGSVPAQISLDPQGQIIGLFFEPPRSQGISLEEAIVQFKALPGEVSLYVAKNGAEQADLNSDRPLAVGSSFKLAILNVLARQIASGERQWSDVVALKPRWQTLPSGFLQNWPPESLLTLDTLAKLTISISDNTATDALLEVVGRDAVEALAPHNRPFLSTRAAFILKAPENAELLERYRQGDEHSRRQILSELDDRPLPSVEVFTQGEPLALDIEWFFSTRELCQLMENVAELPAMQINPGVADPKDWQAVSYKGGSEPGVINLTTHLQDQEGQRYCVSATWNHSSAIDETRFQSIYSGAIAGLKAVK